MEICSAYPIFKGNQVLTAEQLNSAVAYLETQERFSRRHLIGIGIICGLNVSIVNGATPSVAISKGCGISSEGYLFAVEKCELTRFREYNDPSQNSYLQNGDRHFELKELLPSGVSTDDETIEPLTDAILEDKALLLYLECVAKDLKSCTEDDCNEKGWEQQLCLKKLLIDIDDLKILIREGFSLSDDQDLESYFNARFDLTDLDIGRVFDLAALDEDATLADIRAKYLAVLNDAELDQLELALKSAYDAFQPVLAVRYPVNPFSSLSLNNIRNNNNSTDILEAQYVLDFLKDLILAYREFRDAAFDLISKCCPAGHYFPKHLALGLTENTDNCKPSIYRRAFIPSPVHNQQAQLSEKVLMCFERMVRMKDHFRVPDSALSTVKMTPSREKGTALGLRAIPYYYDPAGGLRGYWDFHRKRMCKTDLIVGYDNSTTALLARNLDDCTFLRIEGHFGKNYHSVFTLLNGLVKNYNLPVEIIGLKLSQSTAGIETHFGCQAHDLILIYAAFRSELVCLLEKDIIFFSDLSLDGSDPNYEDGDGQTGVRGRITDTAGNPFPGVNILVHMSSSGGTGGTTDVDGNFRIINLAPGSGILETSFIGYYPIEKPIEIKEGKILLLNIQLTERSFTGPFVPIDPGAQLIDPDRFNPSGPVITPGGQFNVNPLENIGLAGGNIPEYQFMIRSLGGRNPLRYSVGEFAYAYSILADKPDLYSFAFEYFTKDPVLNGWLLDDLFIHNIYYPTLIIDGIESLILALPEDMDEFRIEAFTATYDTLVEVARNYRTQVLEDLRNPNYDPSGNEADILKHLDFLIDACSMRQFEALFAAYGSRLQKIRKERLFYHYVQKHPGMEHLAGVPKGGTFILLYNENNVVVADFALPYICCSDCPPIMTCETTALVFKLPKDLFCKDDPNEYRFILSPPGGTVSGPGIRMELTTGDWFFQPAHADVNAGNIEFNYDASGKVLTYVIAVLNPQAAFTIEEISEPDPINAPGEYRIIVTNKSTGADTFEWSASEGVLTVESQDENGAVLILKETSPGAEVEIKLLASAAGECPATAVETVMTPVLPELSIDPGSNLFCGNDDTTHPVAVSPPGGTLTGQGVALGNDGYTFTPAATGVVNGPVDMTYTVGGLSLTITVQIHLPVVAIDVTNVVEPDPAGQPKRYELTVINATTGADSFEWTVTIGSITVLDDSDPANTLLELTGVERDIKVVLILTARTKDGCAETGSTTFTTPTKPEVTISLDQTNFCFDDETDYVVHVEPTGGTLSGQGTRQDGDKYWFNPSRTAVVPGVNAITLTYECDGQIVTIVIIVNNPVADFTVGTADPTGKPGEYIVPVDLNKVKGQIVRWVPSQPNVGVIQNSDTTLLLTGVDPKLPLTIQLLVELNGCEALSDPVPVPIPSDDPPFVQIINNSPDDLASTIFVTMDDTPLNDGLRFRNASPFIEVTTGNHELRAFSHDGQLLANTTLEFKSGVNYVFVFTGSAPHNQPFQLVFIAEVLTSPTIPDETDFFFHHSAINFPVVDLVSFDDGVFNPPPPDGILAKNLEYRKRSGYWHAFRRFFSVHAFSSGLELQFYEIDLDLILRDQYGNPIDATIVFFLSGIYEDGSNIPVNMCAALSNGDVVCRFSQKPPIIIDPQDNSFGVEGLENVALGALTGSGVTDANSVSLGRSASALNLLAGDRQFAGALGLDDSMVKATAGLLVALRRDFSSLQTRRDYLKGTKNRDIAGQFDGLFESTFQKIKDFRGRNTQEKRQFAYNLFLIQTNQLLNLAVTQEKDLTAGDPLINVFKNLAEKIKLIKQMNVNIDPENRLSEITDAAIDASSGKPNLKAALQDLGAVL